jgi:hypothetical protein
LQHALLIVGTQIGTHILKRDNNRLIYLGRKPSRMPTSRRAIFSLITVSQQNVPEI